jgi:uncharacterized protein YkwD
MVRLCALCAAAISVACLLGPIAAASACSGTDAPPRAGAVAPQARATVCLINAARADHGLAPLHATGALARAASALSRDMVSEGFFSHVEPGGATPAQRIQRTGYLSGVSDWRVGETIAWGTGSDATPAAIVRSWLRSPGHRAILLDGRYDDVGIGIALGAPGHGAGGATVTADLGARG